jgi:glutamyl-tRNA reductase
VTAALAEAGAAEVVVVNRTGEHARAAVGGLSTDLPVRIASLEDLGAELADARLLITAVESEQPLVELAHVARHSGAPLLIVDLGMPRNVAHDVGDLAHVELLDISHLRSVVEQARDERRSEMAAAEAVVISEVERFLDDQRGRGAAPIVVALRERLDEIRRSELSRRSADLTDLSDAQREAVEALTRSIVAKLVHEPTVALKESAGTQRGERLVEATRQLFGL